MKDHTRRVIAYIAGRLILVVNYDLIFDYGLKKYFNFGGECSKKGSDINVYDYGLKKYISGDINSNEFAISLCKQKSYKLNY